MNLLPSHFRIHRICRWPRTVFGGRSILLMAQYATLWPEIDFSGYVEREKVFRIWD